MSTMASQITSLTIVYSTVYSDADQRKHQSSASLAFVRGIHRWPVNSPHKWPVTRKMFPFGDVIMGNHLFIAGSLAGTRQHPVATFHKCSLFVDFPGYPFCGYPGSVISLSYMCPKSDQCPSCVIVVIWFYIVLYRTMLQRDIYTVLNSYYVQWPLPLFMKHDDKT